MSHRRKQKEALRREREERERQAKAAQARKRMVGYGGAFALVLAAVAVAIFALAGGDSGSGDVDPDVLPGGGSVVEQKEFDLTKAAAAANCQLKDVKSPGAVHTNDPGERVKYRSNPPTSGRHFAVPADDGAYSTAPTDEQLVHNEEHGRVIIWFKPNLPKDTRADLKALFDEDTYQMVLAPRAKMPYEVAASAWNGKPEPNGLGRLLTCDSATPEIWDALRAFRDEHRSNGPEPIP